MHCHKGFNLSHTTDSDTWGEIKTGSKLDAWSLLTQSTDRYSHIQMITVLGITNSFYLLNFRQNILITWIIASRLILYKTNRQKLWPLSHGDWNPYVPSYLEDWPICFSWFPSSQCQKRFVRVDWRLKQVSPNLSSLMQKHFTSSSPSVLSRWLSGALFHMVILGIQVSSICHPSRDLPGPSAAGQLVRARGVVNKCPSLSFISHLYASHDDKQLGSNI